MLAARCYLCSVLNNMSNLNRFNMYRLTLNFDLLEGSEGVTTSTVYVEDVSILNVLFMLECSIKSYGSRFRGFPLRDYVPEICVNQLAEKVFEDALQTKSDVNCLCDFVKVSDTQTLMLTASVKMF